MTDELLNERYALAIERIRQIPAEKSVPQPYRDFFAQMAQYLCKMDQIRSRIAEGYLKTASEEELAVFNREPYEDVIGERYETSYGNPAFAVRALGETHGRSLCCLYRELGNAVVWVYEDRLLELTDSKNWGESTACGRRSVCDQSGESRIGDSKKSS